MDTIDLSKLAKALPDRHNRLKGLIRNALDAFSARSDLRIACDHASRASEYIESPPRLPEKAREDVVMALTTSGIVFYARATKSKSDHRSTFDLRPLFSEKERADHEYFCQLRDDAIAHYGPGHIGDNLSLRSDHIMLPPPWTNLVMISRHLYGTLDFSNRLARQAARATLLMQRIYEEKESQLTEALNTNVDDPEIQTAANSAAASLGATIGNEAMAERIMSGPRAGHIRLSDSDTERVAHSSDQSEQGVD